MLVQYPNVPWTVLIAVEQASGGNVESHNIIFNN